MELDALLAGGPTSLILALWLKGIIRHEREVKAVERDRDMWRRIALDGNDTARHAVEVAELAASGQ